MPSRILIAEDSEQTGKQLRALLEAEGYEVDVALDGRAALNQLLHHEYHFFLTDLRMPHLDGMKLVEEVSKRGLPTAVIVMTGFGSVDQAVRAMRLGAYDFLPKPVDVDHLKWVLAKVTRERGLQEEVSRLRERLQNEYAFANILSKSPRMQAVFELIRNVAPTASTVLIEGETGTGKEMAARAIHEASTHRTGPLVAINCAALPETLLESELFGHEKGAFTSASAQRKGRFEMAHQGTLFLDEVGDVPAVMQVKLLRVLQERKFERVGGTQPVEVDVRVVAATNRPLSRLVKKGKFREDLYYRLNVVKIDLPPLRERLEDVPLLAAHFCDKYVRPGEPPRSLSPGAMEALLKHSWPGNVRELENAIERACVTARGLEIQADDLPPEVLRPRAAEGRAPLPIDLGRPLPDLLKEAAAELERRYLRRALKKCRGNVGRVARLSGLSRRSISAKLAEYGLDKNEFKRDEA
jgi:DNA-binding NtrC family response regulator